MPGGAGPRSVCQGRAHPPPAGLAPVVGYGVVFAGGLVVGLMSLIYYGRFMGPGAALPLRSPGHASGG